MTDRTRRVLIPGVYYVFYRPPKSSTVVATPSDQRRPPRRPRAAKTAEKEAEVVEPLEGLYDRRQVKRKQQVIGDRRRALQTAKAFPVCEIGGVTYILNPNVEIIIGLLRSSDK